MPPTTFTVTGTWYKPDGTAATGYVTFTPAQERDLNASGPSIVAQESVKATLSNGSISQALIADENGYNVVETIDNAPVITYEIPGTLAGPIDLSAYGQR